MVRLALLASVGLSLLASSHAKSEIAQELENHYNGYPHTTPNVAAGAQADQRTPQKPQVNSFIPLVFLWTGRTFQLVLTPNFSQNSSALVPRELNGDPGDIPTYVFPTGKKPDVANNYPSLFPPKALGRRLLATPSFPGCISPVAAPDVPFTGNLPAFNDYLVALCSGLKNLTNPYEANATASAGRKLLQLPRMALKIYGEVKKAADTGYPVLTYVFDFTSRPVLDMLTKYQPVGAVPPNGLTFKDCTLSLSDGSFVTSSPGTCFNDSPDKDGTPQPVIARLAAKSFFYGSGLTPRNNNNGTAAGTQVTPIASFNVNFREGMSLTYPSRNVTMAYGVYADISGIYPGN